MADDEDSSEHPTSSSLVVGRADSKDVVTLRSSKMQSSWHICHQDFLSKGKQAALDRAFSELDLSHNGVLDKSDIEAFMTEASKKIRLKVNHTVVSDAVEAILDHVGSSQVITKEQFVTMFERHPDLWTCFDDEVTMSVRQQSIRAQESAEPELEDDNNLRVWTHTHTHWKNKKIAYIWGVLYILANIAAFVYKFLYYAQDVEAQAVFGTCINVARGSAQCLNLNACLILLPICRRFITRLRATRLRFYFPFDAALESHIYLGCVILFFTTVHVCAHICDFHRFALADEMDIYALFGESLGVVPASISERWLLLLQQPAGITGVIMVVCILVAYPLTLVRHKHFDTFWLTHHLLLVMLVALCCHGIGNLLEPFASIYWIMVPMALYIIPRFWRESCLSECKVLDVKMKEGDVVGLKLQRPKSWDKYVKAGMYAFLNVPHVSCLEWHPFTLTSAPAEDFIEFHFKNVGDWTGHVHNLLEGLSNDAEGGSNSEVQALKVRVEGPIGASSQGFSDYPIVVLIGAGIGVTPMISVLKQLLATPGKMKSTFLYWTVRDRASFEWFTCLMDDIYESDQGHVIQIRHFLTSAKDDDRDIGAVLLHHATRAQHKKTNFDLILGQCTHHQVQVGRPDWEEELVSIKQEAKELGHKDCGIFLCGPEVMAKAIDKASFAMSKNDPAFHFYFTKETF
jgi:respiratory burst oxidase